MFDLSNLDNVQVDHMLRETRYRVLREFTDASGQLHAAGGGFLYRGAHLNLPARRLTLRVTVGGVQTEWLFEFASGDGPRPGNLKEYFEAVSYEPAPRPAPRTEAEASAEPHPSPAGPPPEAPPHSTAQASAALDELHAAAMRLEFDRADALYRTILCGNSLGDYHLEKLGSWLLHAAHEAGGVHFAAAQWFARQALDCWQSWAAGSTSGGEGAARTYEVSRIRGELARYL
ncbi:MAG: hypothetical protein IT164_17685 [Bryobacterales bacterium]|nr:hypothetical protein [Bryobacterales bacterium]